MPDVKREDVERWLEYAQENIRHFGPREGSAIPAEALVALCERWIEVEDAPGGAMRFDYLDEALAVVIVRAEDDAATPFFELEDGQRVRIIPDDSGRRD